MKSKMFLIGLVAVFGLMAVSVQAHDDPTVKPGFYAEKYEKMKNPLPFNRNTVALGRKIYNDQQCASCHGANGDGKGKAAVVGRFTVMPRNFADADVMNKRTDGMLFFSITKGVHGTWMLPREDLLTDRQRWALVNYIRTFAPAEEEGTTPKEGSRKKTAGSE